mgnify:CR=1 FL=1
MAKVKTAFFCQNCGAQHSQWMGQCNRCMEWNTLTEEVLNTGKEAGGGLSANAKHAPKAVAINEVPPEKNVRIPTGNSELDRVLGGGLVAGSTVLIGGEPGIGKSTLMLQMALQMPRLCLYVCGEESAQQVQLRAQRLGINNEACYLLAATSTGDILQQAKQQPPELLIVDSVQTLQSPLLDSAAGSVSQIRQSAAEMIQFAKESGIPVLLVGHITKDGQIAGPKILEHMVDTVLQFEGDRNHFYRLLRAQKNRFGSTHEIGIYEMAGEGLRVVNNPSDILLSQRDSDLSGNAIAATLEGIRPMLIEVQALCSTAVYGTPQRSTTGFEVRRLNMLLAVLEKRCGFKLAAKDVFLNLTGGLRVTDPALDLAVMVAILSSAEDIALSPKACFAAEVGLSGEIRPVPRLEQRINEAAKMGFEEIYVSKHGATVPAHTQIKVHQAGKIEQVFQLLFG